MYYCFLHHCSLYHLSNQFRLMLCALTPPTWITGSIYSGWKPLCRRSDDGWGVTLTQFGRSWPCCSPQSWNRLSPLLREKNLRRKCRCSTQVWPNLNHPHTRQPHVSFRHHYRNFKDRPEQVYCFSFCTCYLHEHSFQCILRMKCLGGQQPRFEGVESIKSIKSINLLSLCSS